MTLRSKGPGAYAPPSAVISVIERYRDRGLPTPLSADVLVRAGLTTESLAPRTVQSLKLLDLLDDDAQPTAELNALGQVPSDQFKERLAAVLRTAYADVFQFTDPVKDDYERIRDAFRPYNPASLRDRMTTLFLGLAEYAEMISETRAKELTGRRIGPGRTKTPRPSGARSTNRQTEPPNNGSGAGVVEHRGASGPGMSDTGGQFGAGGLPPALEGFMRALPQPGTSVSMKRREQYVQAFGSVFDLSYDVQEEGDGGE